VDLREKRQLELAGQMARVKARARPWRSIIALVLAIAAGGVAGYFRQGFIFWSSPGHLADKAVTAGTAAGFFVFAVIAMLGLSGKARDSLRPVTGSSHASVIRYSIVLLGSIGILIVTLDLLKVPIGQLVVGGALTTILLGIAAQQSLGNVFAGMVLLLSRPFVVGDSIQLRSGSLGGLIEGTVTEIGITYMRMDTREGVLCLPNSVVLAAGVGPARPAPLSDGSSPSP
jgi:small-conductance mechanosensitive channel